LRRLDHDRPGYQLLGLLILIQLCVSTALFLRRKYSSLLKDSANRGVAGADAAGGGDDASLLREEAAEELR